MNVNVQTYTTVTALGADAVVSGGFLYLRGFAPMLFKGIKPTSIVAPVTEVLQVSTGTPTVVNSTVYQISITYTNKLTGNIESWVSSPYTSDANATDTEICNNIRDQVNASNVFLPVVATGTTTLILTAETGFATFDVNDVGPGVMAGIGTPGTPGVWAVGLGSDIKNGENANRTAMALIVDASYYYQVEMDYANGDPTGTQEVKSPLIGRNVLYVLSTATNIASLVGTYGTLTQALAGYAATYVAGTGTLAADDSDDLLTLATGTFPAQNIVPGDVLFQDGETTYYVVNSVITVATALSNVAADNAAAAYTIIHRTKI